MTQLILVEITFRLVIQDLEFFQNTLDLRSLIDSVLDLLTFIQQEEKSTLDTELRGISQIEEIIIQIILRVMRSDDCLKSILSHPKFERILVSIFEIVSDINLSQDHNYSCLLGLTNLVKEDSHREKYCFLP